MRPIDSDLALLELDTDRLRISQAVDVAVPLRELRALPNARERILTLSRWCREYPKATSQLLRVIARDPSISLELAPTVLGLTVMTLNEARLEEADDVLAAAFPKLTPPWRDAAADRPGVRALIGLQEGDGYVAVRGPDRAWLWPSGKPFPSEQTIEGVQARLNYLGFGAGPVTGEWTELSRGAFTRWQVLSGLEPTGELDEYDCEDLGDETPAAPE